MRRQDKIKNMKKVNLMTEQRQNDTRSIVKKDNDIKTGKEGDDVPTQDETPDGTKID